MERKNLAQFLEQPPGKGEGPGFEIQVLVEIFPFLLSDNYVPDSMQRAPLLQGVLKTFLHRLSNFSVQHPHLAPTREFHPWKQFER